MKDRCLNPKNKYFKNYGERGIKICERWMKFENFLEDMGEASKSMSIDRLNNDDGYYKGNCKWSTFTEQMNNTRRNRYLDWNGKKQSVAQWSKELGCSYDKIMGRVKRNLPIEKIFLNL